MNQYIQLSDSYQDLMGFKYWMRKHYLIIYFLKNTNLQYWKKKQMIFIYPNGRLSQKMGYKARKPIPSSLVGSKRGNPNVFEYTKFSRPCLRIWDNDGQQPFFFWIFFNLFFYVICIFFITCFNYIFNFFTSFL